ncbi:MAG: 2'-5' RNA ligase family protein [Alphaproteobacteria bacterium]|nr:2'-5' RNA ligase family protein [Alphaproteobacteria bacterium]
MSLVVLGRPSMAAADRAWIDALRDRHRGAVFERAIGAHVTLVFPTEATDPTSATSHLATVAAETAPIDLLFRATMPWLDRYTGETYVYLVPDAGNGKLIRLHDHLYSGPFSDVLRLDLPFVPHITLGRFGEAKVAKALVDDLNAQDIELRARLDTVELFRLSEGEQPRRLAEVALRG